MSEGSRLSAWSKKRLQEQGLRGFSEGELCQHRFGNRFAYFVCLCLVVIGLTSKSQAWLLAASVIALLGIFPPHHPIDYLYNYGVRFLIGRPKLPPRPNQGRFACSVATVLLAGINYALYAGNLMLMWILAAVLLTSAVLVTCFDLCVPSLIYNALFERRPK